MGYKINIFNGVDWSNVLTHENIDNLQGGNGVDEFYHLSADQHSWIDQDVTIGSSPSFQNTNMSGDISIWNNNLNYITENDVTLNVFTQTTPASTWTINHNFGSKYAIVQVYKDDDTLIYPESIELVDNNNLSITFDVNVSGYAIYSKVSGTVPSSNPTEDHGSLTGLSGDDHIQYTLVDGTRGFTGTISGIYPTISSHITTKAYVDNHTWVASSIVDFNDAVSNHPWLDQDCSIGSSPQFSNTNMYGDISIWTNNSAYIKATDVTYENLNANGDVGTGSSQVSKGNHSHHNIFATISVSGDIDISSGWTDLTFDTDTVIDSLYTFSNDKEIQVSQTGLYKIKYDVSTYIYSYSNYCDSLIKIIKDTGSGYADVDGSFSGQFNGSSSNGLNSSSKEITLSLNSGDKIKIQARRLSGLSTIKTYPNSCTFAVEFIR